MSGSRRFFGHSRVDLADWYRTHGEAVLRRCRRLSNSDAEARDLLQEVFLKAQKYQRSYRGGSPLSWLLTIADRTAYDAIRKNKREPVTEVSENDLATLGEVSAAMRHALVRRLLARTDERTALIVIRRYFDEMTLDEIADELSLNERTVRRALAGFIEDARGFVGEKAAAHA